MSIKKIRYIVILFLLTLLAAAGFAYLSASVRKSENAAETAKKLQSAFPEIITLTKADFVRLDRTIQKEGPERAWEFLKTSSLKKNDFHFLTHFLGRRIYEKFGLGGLRFCGVEFGGFGCYHSIVSSAVAEHGENAVEDIRNACFRLNAEAKVNACLHGTGHGFSEFTGYKLLPALGYCDILKKDEQFKCWEGVFMEQIISAPKSFYKPEDPWYPCHDIPQKYQDLCIRRQPAIMMNQLGLDLQTSTHICLTAPTAKMTSACAAGIAFRIAVLSDGNNPFVLEKCRTLFDTLTRQQECISGAAESMIKEHLRDWQNLAPLLCDELTAEHKKECKLRIKPGA